MLELLSKALSLISTGVIILNDEQKIMFFNSSIEKLCKIPERKAVGKHIGEVCPVFQNDEYKNMIDLVLETGQSRFCSSAIHKSFVFENGQQRESKRQNMKVEYISSKHKPYVVIQIIDFSDSYKNFIKLKGHINQLEKGVEDLRHAKKQTEEMAKYDNLTGLYNRFYFENMFKKLSKVADIEHKKIGIFFVDLDGFKQVNDTYGHMVGDALIQMVAARMKNNLRHNDFIMRLGGDEFVVAADYNADGSEGNFSKRLLCALRKPYYVDDNSITVTASIGVSIYPDDSRILIELIDKADRAMYSSKEHGKNMVHIYNQIKG